MSHCHQSLRSNIIRYRIYGKGWQQDIDKHVPHQYIYIVTVYSKYNLLPDKCNDRLRPIHGVTGQ